MVVVAARFPVAGTRRARRSEMDVSHLALFKSTSAAEGAQGPPGCAAAALLPAHADDMTWSQGLGEWHVRGVAVRTFEYDVAPRSTSVGARCQSDKSKPFTWRPARSTRSRSARLRRGHLRSACSAAEVERERSFDVAMHSQTEVPKARIARLTAHGLPSRERSLTGREARLPSARVWAWALRVASQRARRGRPAHDGGAARGQADEAATFSIHGVPTSTQGRRLRLREIPRKCEGEHKSAMLLFALVPPFGFRSVIPSQVQRSLLAAENALGVE